MFPPWINKFYILDLRANNSLIRWIVDQGYTLFVVSWVNPDSTYSNVGLEDYIEQGYLEAIDPSKKHLQGQKNKCFRVLYCRDNTKPGHVYNESAR